VTLALQIASAIPTSGTRSTRPQRSQVLVHASPRTERDPAASAIPRDISPEIAHVKPSEASHRPCRRPAHTRTYGVHLPYAA
jgi:hypothetical protein